MTTATRPASAPAATRVLVLARPSARLLEASKLQRDASAFKGWPVFWEEPTAVRKWRGGLPPAPSGLAGEVIDARWDPGYSTAEDPRLGFERGAVVGRVAMTDSFEALLSRLPTAVKLRMNADPSFDQGGSFEVCVGSGRVPLAVAADKLVEAPAVQLSEADPAAGAVEDMRRRGLSERMIEAFYTGGGGVDLRSDGQVQREARLAARQALAPAPARSADPGVQYAESLRRRGLSPSDFGVHSTRETTT